MQGLWSCSSLNARAVDLVQLKTKKRKRNEERIEETKEMKKGWKKRKRKKIKKTTQIRNRKAKKKFKNKTTTSCIFRGLTRGKHQHSFNISNILKAPVIRDGNGAGWG